MKFTRVFILCYKTLISLSYQMLVFYFFNIDLAIFHFLKEKLKTYHYLIRQSPHALRTTCFSNGWNYSDYTGKKNLNFWNIQTLLTVDEQQIPYTWMCTWYLLQRINIFYVQFNFLFNFQVFRSVQQYGCNLQHCWDVYILTYNKFFLILSFNIILHGYAKKTGRILCISKIINQRVSTR